MKKRQKNFRISPDAAAWLKQITDEEGTNETAMLERLIRAEARRRKLPKPAKDATDE